MYLWGHLATLETLKILLSFKGQEDMDALVHFIWIVMPSAKTHSEKVVFWQQKKETLCEK